MKATFELEDSTFFFDDRRPDRVVFASRFDKPMEVSLGEFIEVLNRVAQERQEWKTKPDAKPRKKREVKL